MFHHVIFISYRKRFNNRHVNQTVSGGGCRVERRKDDGQRQLQVKPLPDRSLQAQYQLISKNMHKQ